MKILLCCCANTDLMPAGERQRLLDALNASDANITVVADLCRQVAAGTLTLPAPPELPLTIIACRPRAVTALLKAADGECKPDTCRCFDLRHQPAAEIIAALKLRPTDQPGHAAPAPAETAEWPPWFPVIDQDRCVNCGQCRDFCLFGVYGTDADDHVCVANPSSCKNNCPACARVCPQAAIIFPKHDQAPIDGAPITDEHEEARRIRVDVQKILGDDPYEALKKRRAKARKRLVDRDKLARAKRERQAYLPRRHRRDTP